ncbi:MAG: hypothetical protein AVDCRST_MAG09-1472 [uncultured Sphingomonas sp.]|uniref:Uncharacterized protein n=1 Tax=uncultured Sphingomonas sp. TaxID=158754 RepID=A0A6J4SZA2_9SPHN|nr:MAG: hypothetical protein AVDCRST_MAG09-1472 [uncultured Sphingomonas sp.]
MSASRSRKGGGSDPAALSLSQIRPALARPTAGSPRKAISTAAAIATPRSTSACRCLARH